MHTVNSQGYGILYSELRVQNKAISTGAFTQPSRARMEGFSEKIEFFSVSDGESGEWGKWKEITSLLVNRGIPLHHRGKVYEACIRSVMLYRVETWALTARLEGILLSCDRRMLRYMAGVT